MSIGEISKPIKRQDSIIFLKLVDKRKIQSEKIDLDKYKLRVIAQKRNEMFDLYSKSHLSKLKNNNLVEYQWKIIILSGDPNSINSEIIIKSWKKLSVTTKKKIYFISNNELLKKQFKKLKYSIKTKVVQDFKEDVKGNYLKIINLKLKFTNPFKVKKSGFKIYNWVIKSVS